MDMILWIRGLTEADDHYLIALLAVIMIASTVDYLFGWTNAYFNSKIDFNSGKALYGIVKKMMYFIVLVLFMFVALLIAPEKVALPSIYILFVGYLLSELNSIAAHLNVANDGKKGELFAAFLKRIFKGDEK